MPLASDGVIGDGIFGATAYRVGNQDTSGVRPSEGIELSFYPLD